MTICLCQRSERSGKLIPGRASRAQASGLDIFVSEASSPKRAATTEATPCLQMLSQKEEALG